MPDGVFKKKLNIDIANSLGWSPSDHFVDKLKYTYNWYENLIEKT